MPRIWADYINCWTVCYSCQSELLSDAEQAGCVSGETVCHVRRPEWEKARGGNGICYPLYLIKGCTSFCRCIQVHFWIKECDVQLVLVRATTINVMDYFGLVTLYYLGFTSWYGGEVDLWCCASGMSNVQRGSAFKGTVVPCRSFLFLRLMSSCSKCNVRKTEKESEQLVDHVCPGSRKSLKIINDSVYQNANMSNLNAGTYDKAFNMCILSLRIKCKELQRHSHAQ